jgi:tRNA U34 5-methylaminomethyl-2-thiouridine-forming methyltransferase MnmC
MARDRAARASSRQEEMLRENARRSGLDPDNINPAVANKVRENMGGADFSLGMKKGGKVKRMASGGMASGGMTASRRGDGIASRGKTRGKIC